MHSNEVFVKAKTRGPDADSNVEARVIHDLSYPSDNSINSSSDPEILPELQYEHVD
ncbi:hypothetical protein L916_08879 [Phytophthora nicotianae]|uniref:Uncharacterized protein n=1 Tax=Phytophthora nicotianae TaxID=4792 RepID=W2J069_PHYNI|nr:hypothetical protein L916_08879 [Phytophthora nicotianae]